MNVMAMRKWLLLSLAALTLMGLSAGVRAAADSMGTEFYFAFQQNNVGGGAGKLSLFITGQQDTQGVVKIPGLNFSANFAVLANKVTTVVLPSGAQQLPNNSVSKLGVHVTAQNEVTVYGLNQFQYTTDAFLALPADVLGLEYLAMSYIGSHGPSQVAVVGAFDNTQVTITPSATVQGRAAGVPFTITLNRNDTFQIRGSGAADLTGTSITATSPVAVMSGVECVNVPVGVGYCDHIVEMMPPVTTWGKSFLTVPLATRLRGDVFRILASQDSTKVTINGALVATLNRGKFHETVLTSRSEIKTSAPALVTQYSPGQGFDGVISDPFMMLIPPTEQFLNQYTFSTPATGFSSNFVNIVVPSGAVSTLALDGAGINPALFSPIGASGFSGAQLPISLGSHTLTSNIPFGIYVYGFGSYDSYGYPGGMAFQFINPVGDPYPPNLRLTPIGDTIQGTATDSEDINANGMLDAGEDLNANGKIDRRSEDVNGNGILDAGEDLNANKILDRDTGIFRVELTPGAVNLKLNVLAFVPGALSVNFTISLIDPKALGTGVLRIEDGAGNKIESPISLSGIPTLKNVRVIDTISTNNIDLDPASFSKAPFSITSAGNQTLIEWRFDSFPANLTQDLGFDVVLKNPVPGENRLVSHKLELLYTDVNGKTVRTELGSQYVNVLPSSYQIGTVTDKSTYSSNEPVSIISTVKNLSTFPGSAAVRLSIKDANGVQVAQLGQLPAQTIAAGGSNVFAGLNFNTGNILIGNYTVYAELVEGGGKVTATASAPFLVVTAGTSVVSLRTTADRLVYHTTDTVAIQNLIRNLTPNVIVDNATLRLTVLDPANKVFFTKDRPLSQLTPGALLDIGINVPLSAAPIGMYRVEGKVLDASQAALATAATSFEVREDLSKSLTGKVTVGLPTLDIGEAQTCTDILTNVGSQAIAALEIHRLLVNIDTQVTHDDRSLTLALAAGQANVDIRALATTGLLPGNYACLLQARVDGVLKTLGHAPFVLAQPPKLEVTQTLPRQGRVLVLLSCKQSEEEDDKKASARFKSGGEDVDDDKDNALCLSARLKFVGDYLVAKNIPHLITTDQDTFKRAFRSGFYNTYWISGGAHKLKDRLAEEVREAVHRGDGLLMDGIHDERNKTLDEVIGVKYEGKLNPKNLSMVVTGPLFAPGTLATLGRALKLEAQGGVVHAKFIGFDKEKSSDDKPKEYPALVSNQYGLGQGLVAAFDLVASLQQTPSLPWDALFATGLGHITPQVPKSYSAGAYVPVKTIIQNLGRQVDLEVLMQLPPGASVVDTQPAAVLNASGQPAWRFNLALDASQTLNLNLRLPLSSGNHPLVTTINYLGLALGQSLTYGTYNLSLPVTSAGERAAQLIGNLSALVLNRAEEREARDHAVKYLQQALNEITAGQFEKAIESLLNAVKKLEDIESQDMGPHILNIDLLLQEAGLKWWQGLP